ncbi:Major facilitator superfamily permease [Paramicrosporidium saccamoebae]|uniref:Major facilitator superfamily permease n=1 Tax=Paramicrosporidium saccamoebae TaxID=1246581 RepID=A0A2H9TLL9_9FUNG|nr:Major facilitator superfamily permease [Paramicrosporidium saccamoebae]
MPPSTLTPTVSLDQQFCLAPKAIYFAIGILNYSFYVFRMRFFTEYFGFGEDQYGIVQTFWNVFSFAGVTLWSNLADWTSLHKGLLVGLCLSMGICFEGVLFKGLVAPEKWIYLAVAVFALYGLLIGGLLPLADDQILRLLERRYEQCSKQYGRQALFGMVAYGLISFSLGKLLDRCGASAMIWIVPSSAIFAAVMVACFGYGRMSAKRSSINQQWNHPESSEANVGFFKYLETLGQRNFLLFLLVILASGFGRQTLAIFLPNYLSEELGLSSGQVGNAYLMGTMFSVLFYFAAPYALSHLGIWPMLLIGQLSLVARLASYAFLTPTPSMVPFIELLNGMAYSFTHLAAVQQVSLSAPPGWDAAFQAAYGCAHVQFPAVVCSLVGGYIYKYYRGRWLLTVALTTPVMSSIALTIFLILRVARRRTCNLQS